ncbi:DinB family protein [Roseivirga sp. E12]|uniref:DinB family protein n=1 Tax=Roseivirga sp. E12 TaxID=2819237 RepID=UPI001ABC12A4|nr:DinB family protein [Roseivirga sp. E12]MBO3699351.1 DinB family protein [Roseivirga sp. E12]
MVLEASKHIDSCQKDLQYILDEVRVTIEGLDETTLNCQEGEGKWSMLQCLKHMSIAVGVYNNNTHSALESGNHSTPSVDYKSHWKGDMFVKMIAPKENGKVKNNMKTMKTMNPDHSLNPQETIEEFFSQHKEYLRLMEKSRSFNLNRVKVNTAIGPLVKLRLGDAYRFIVAHAHRHLIQLKRIKAAVSG